MLLISFGENSVGNDLVRKQTSVPWEALLRRQRARDGFSFSGREGSRCEWCSWNAGSSGGDWDGGGGAGEWDDGVGGGGEWDSGVGGRYTSSTNKDFRAAEHGG